MKRASKAYGIMTAALAAVMMSSVATPVQAHGYKNGTVEIRHPWTLASGVTSAGGMPGTSAVVIMKLKNVSDKPERLLSAKTSIASKVTVVGETPAPGAAPNEALVLPAGQTVELKATSAHIRLDGMTAPLHDYDTFPMTLIFEHSGALDIDVTVEEHPEQ